MEFDDQGFFSIELITFAVDFIPLAIEFGTFAVDSFSLAVEFHAFSVDFVPLAGESVILELRVILCQINKHFGSPLGF